MVRRRKKQAFRDAAVRVLVAHGYEIDPLDVLPLVPADVPAAVLLPY